MMAQIYGKDDKPTKLRMTGIKAPLLHTGIKNIF
jgi:hypothetical protein